MMPKTLDQVRYYQAHYRQIYPKAKTKGQKVLRQYLQKLSNQIIKLQGKSPANFELNKYILANTKHEDIKVFLERLAEVKK